MPGTGLNSNVDTRRPFDLGAPALAPEMLILVRHSRLRALVCAQFAGCINSVFKLTKLRNGEQKKKVFSKYLQKILLLQMELPFALSQNSTNW